MTQTQYNEQFPCSRGELWQIVTAIYDDGWRKDIEYVSIEKNRRFIEFVSEMVETVDTSEKTGFKYERKKTLEKRLEGICFEVKELIEGERIALSFDSERVCGALSFDFAEVEGGSSLKIVGNAEGKKLFMKPFAKTWLINRLNAYTSNLRAAAQTPPKPSGDKMTPIELVELTRAELEKNPLYDEDKHLYLLLNMFNRRYTKVYENVCNTTQAEVSGGAARIVSYRVTEQEDGSFLREIAFERRTTDYREAVSVLTQLVINTAKAMK